VFVDAGAIVGDGDNTFVVLRPHLSWRMLFSGSMASYSGVDDDIQKGDPDYVQIDSNLTEVLSINAHYADVVLVRSVPG